ncbi:MAG: hypothetical protein PUF09_04405 [Bacteroidales bacterium]|nr:hypothetical protein [Bacteroidales bacterium]
MKKFVYLAVGVALMASCSSDFDLSEGGGNAGGSDVIGFQMRTGNTSRATTGLQSAGHYNFGVFGYKKNDKVNPIMGNYLVGYLDAKGYQPRTGSTVGDQPGVADGTSYWMYEKMGYGQFNGTYAGETVNPNTPYASNNEGQYLRYWDKSADHTCFYAYAPYVNTGATGKTVTYVDGTAKGSSDDTYVLTIPNGTIEHGFDDPSTYEFMYASAKVLVGDYGHDVSLKFNRLNAKVNIKFWEDIEGYSVRLIDLTPAYGVAATPSIKEAGQGSYGYKLGKIYTKNGVKIKFNADAEFQSLKQYAGETTSAPLDFKTPTASLIGENRVMATPSPSTYYAIPKGSGANVLADGELNYSASGSAPATELAQTGLTFHVSYELISTTGEKITVTDATVHVPKDYCNWVANKHYTYIFRITKNSNGSTGTTTPKPEDPEVPTVNALYPIVFDNCVVEDWTTEDSEWDITEGNTAIPYHNITLDKYSVNAGEIIKITDITDSDRQNGHSVDYSKITVTKKGDTTPLSVYTAATKTIATGTLAAGVYTVTYTCPNYPDPATQPDPNYANQNHPKSWSVDFVVGNTYTLSTADNLTEVGLGGKLPVTVQKDGTTFQADADHLYIEYPKHVDGSKVKVKKVTVSGVATNLIEVAADATPGTYNLCFKTEYATDGGNVIQVTVAKTPIVVKDYQHTLSTYLVKLGASPVDIKVNTPTLGTNVTEQLNVSSTMGTTGVNITGKTIKVYNTAAEGTYTVTYTVNKGRLSKVIETTTFKVENTYDVTLSKNYIRRDLNRANDADYGTDFITVSLFKNGKANNNAPTGLTITKEDGTDVTSSCKFVEASNNTCKLQVSKTVTNGTYYVVYTGQTGKVVKAKFTVQN